MAGFSSYLTILAAELIAIIVSSLTTIVINSITIFFIIVISLTLIAAMLRQEQTPQTRVISFVALGVVGKRRGVGLQG